MPPPCSPGPIPAAGGCARLPASNGVACLNQQFRLRCREREIPILPTYPRVSVPPAEALLQEQHEQWATRYRYPGMTVYWLWRQKHQQRREGQTVQEVTMQTALPTIRSNLRRSQLPADTGHDPRDFGPSFEKPDLPHVRQRFFRVAGVAAGRTATIRGSIETSARHCNMSSSPRMELQCRCKAPTLCYMHTLMDTG